MSTVFLDGAIYSFHINNNIFMSNAKDFDRTFYTILAMTGTRYTKTKNTFTVAKILVEK